MLMVQNSNNKSNTHTPTGRERKEPSRRQVKQNKTEPKVEEKEK